MADLMNVVHAEVSEISISAPFAISKARCGIPWREARRFFWVGPERTRREEARSSDRHS